MYCVGIRRRIGGVVGHVLRERPAAERRVRVVAFERDVAEVDARPSTGACRPSAASGTRSRP